MIIIWAIILFCVALLLFFYFYLYYFKLAKKKLTNVREFYAKFFEESNLNFSCPKINEIYFSKTIKILCFYFLIPVSIFGLIDCYLIVELGFYEEFSLILFVYTILFIILFIISFPISKYLWRKETNINIVPNDQVLTEFHNFKIRFSNSDFKKVNIKSLSDDKLFQKRYSTCEKFWSKKVKKAMKKNNDFFVIEIFLEYLDAFYAIQEPDIFSSPNISKSDKYNPYVNMILKNFFDLIG